MPTYEYLCKSCGERLEVQQRFSDEPLTVCPTCQGSLRKVFGNVGIAFKGSGFYKTDSRGSKSASSTSSTTDSSSGASSTSGSKESAGSSTSDSSSAGSSSTASSSAS